MTKPIRILITGMTSNPGGVETMIMNIYRNLDRDKVQFDFLVHHATTIVFEQEILKMGGRIHKVYYGRREDIFRHYFELIKLLKKNTDIRGIHLNTCVLEDIDIQIIAKFKGIPLRIVHSHNSDYMSNVSKLTKLFERVNRKLLNYIATDLFACSHDAGEWMFKGNNFSVIPNAISLDNFRYCEISRISMRKELNLESSFVVGHVGRFSYQKNHEFLLDIFLEIVRKDSSAKLLLVGQGELEYAIKEKVRNLSLIDHVIFLGVRNDINNLMQAMDVFLLPSRFEGLGIVLIEAQVSGLQCFTSKTHVPLEAKVSDFLNYIDLKESPTFWANKIVDNHFYDRSDQSSVVGKKGFDIKEVTMKLQKKYLCDGDNNEK